MDEMAIQFHHPGMDPRAVAASMRLFAAELMPEIRTWGRPGEAQRPACTTSATGPTTWTRPWPRPPGCSASGRSSVLKHVDLGDFRFRGEPATLDHSAAFAAWGPVLLELDQVHEVRPACAARGPRRAAGHGQPRGLDHRRSGRGTGALAAAGCGLLTTSAGGAVADWFSGGSLFGHPVEIHQPAQPVLDFWAVGQGRRALTLQH